jgi:hypothetical protein
MSAITNTTTGDLDDRTREFEMILVARDEARAKPLLQVDLQSRKDEIAAAA